MSDLGTQLRACGVVGAGGSGFPAYVKAQSRVEFVLANGAECEPLLHKDYELMKAYPAEIVGGMRRMMESTGAGRGKFGIKEKNAKAVEAIRGQVGDAPIDMTLLGDFYPSGDEYELVYWATGRLIPPAGIPLQVGCVVSNVETLYNVELAARGEPVTRKFLSVAGAVRTPKAFWAPIGTTIRETIELAGGSTVPDPAVFVSGLMMGSFCRNLDDVITKTTGGLILLPRDHYLVTRRDRTPESMRRIGKSACDQCSYCTEFCPRYLLGYDVQPHKVMRSLGFTASGKDLWNQSAELCCACGLCTLYACPEDLYPKEACDESKQDLRSAGIKFVQQKPVRVHPMKDGRRVPLAQLRKRLKVEQYESPTPFEDIPYAPSQVRIPMKQHAGKAALPVVQEGKRVKLGDVLGRVPDGELGADVHASLAGRVTRVSGQEVEITA